MKKFYSNDSLVQSGISKGVFLGLSKFKLMQTLERIGDFDRKIEIKLVNNEKYYGFVSDNRGRVYTFRLKPNYDDIGENFQVTKRIGSYFITYDFFDINFFRDLEICNRGFYLDNGGVLKESNDDWGKKYELVKDDSRYTISFGNRRSILSSLSGELNKVDELNMQTFFEAVSKIIPLERVDKLIGSYEEDNKRVDYAIYNGKLGALNGSIIDFDKTGVISYVDGEITERYQQEKEVEVTSLGDAATSFSSDVKTFIKSLA